MQATAGTSDRNSWVQEIEDIRYVCMVPPPPFHLGASCDGLEILVIPEAKVIDRSIRRKTSR